MNSLRLKDALRTLAQDALSRMGGLSDYHRNRVAFFDTLYDEPFIDLASFPTATAELEAVGPDWAKGESKRLALQFVYAFLTNLGATVFDANAFEIIWTAFERELATKEWRHVSVANLQNFRSDSAVIQLGDGVSIRDLSTIDFKQTVGWGETERRYFIEDRGTLNYAGPHAIFVEGKTTKSQDNFLLEGDPSAWHRAQRGILSLRLLKSGDVGMGRLFHTRPGFFNVGLGGMSSEGYSVRNIGSRYQLGAPEIPSLQAMFGILTRFDASYSSTWRNVALALRRFSFSYDRYPPQNEDRVVDAFIAIEALLSRDIAELTFKLAFRAAGILATDNDERTKLFGEMKEYYDVRSKIVHGAQVKPKELRVIQAPEPLLDITRRLLVAFLHLANSGQHKLETFYLELDSILQHSDRRLELRECMHLS